MQTKRRDFAGAVVITGILACSTPALAKEGAKEAKRATCTAALTAFKTAVDQDQAGHLREARESLASCIEATACGGLVPKCRALDEKILSEMPTVVPMVTDESGAPRADVQVKVDGRPLCSQLDGKGLPVDAGMHEFTFSTDRGVFATEKVMVAEGQRNRIITASMGAAPNRPVQAAAAVPAPVIPVADASPTPEPKPTTDKTELGGTGAPPESPGRAGDGPAPGRSLAKSWALPKSALPYALGGVGLASVAAGGLLTYWGNKDNSTLETTCNPNCKPASLDHVRSMYVAADIAFGVGAAALAVTTWLFASSYAETKAHAQSAVAVDVLRVPSGAMATVSGGF